MYRYLMLCYVNYYLNTWFLVRKGRFVGRGDWGWGEILGFVGGFLWREVFCRGFWGRGDGWGGVEFWGDLRGGEWNFRSFSYFGGEETRLERGILGPEGLGDWVMRFFGGGFGLLLIYYFRAFFDELYFIRNVNLT